MRGGVFGTRSLVVMQPRVDAERLMVEYSKSKAAALEVTINGRPASIPTEASKGKSLVEMVITKDGYEQLLQRP